MRLHPRAAALAALLAVVAAPLGALPADAEHVPVNDATFPWGACAKVCIPAVVRPRFDEAPYLSPKDLVVGVALGGDARAYPLQVLVWHEIVNDVVGGEPVAVTFCPLCGSAVTYRRDPGGQVLTFQVSGRLHRNDLVMQDDETGSLWPQLLGEAVSGPLHGTRLETVTSALATWEAWRSQHPGTLLLARPRCSDFPEAVSGCPTASPSPARRYGEDPYGGYADSRRIGLGPEERGDVAGLHPKALVVGLALGNASKAWDVATAAAEGVILDELDGQPLVVATHAGTPRVFRRDPGQRFVPLNATHMRDPLGTPWSKVTGEAADGGALQALPVATTFWFAWLDFHPATLLHGRARVLATEPREGDPLGSGQEVVIRFSHPMDRASVERGLRLEPAGKANLTWADDRTLRVAVPGRDAGQPLTVRIEGATAQGGLPLPATALAFRGQGVLADLAEVPGLGAVLWVALAGLLLYGAWRWVRPKPPAEPPEV